MKGVVAKAITLFDQTGADMDKACLATFLAESLFAPTILLQDYIAFEEIRTHKIRATITCGGQVASGIFTFNEQYEMISFTTNDRAATGTDAEKVNGVWEQRLRIHYNCVGTIEIPSALPLPTPDVSVNTRKGVVVNYAPCDVAI